MPSSPTRAYQRHHSLRLLSQAATVSLPEREGLYREVVQLNLSVAEAIAHRYARRLRSAAPVRQVAGVGLDKAVRTFDPNREPTFWEHATSAITEEVRRFRYPVRVFRRAPPCLDGLVLQIITVVPELVDALGRPPRASDIAERIQANVDEVIEVLATDGRTSRLRLSRVQDRERT